MIIDRDEIYRLYDRGTMKKIRDLSPSFGRFVTKEEWEKGLVSPSLEGTVAPKPHHVFYTGRGVGYVKFDYRTDMIFKIEQINSHKFDDRQDIMPDTSSYIVVPLFVVEMTKTLIPTPNSSIPGVWNAYEDHRTLFAIQMQTKFSCENGTLKQSGFPGDWIVFDFDTDLWFAMSPSRFHTTYKFIGG